MAGREALSEEEELERQERLKKIDDDRLIAIKAMAPTFLVVMISFLLSILSIKVSLSVLLIGFLTLQHFKSVFLILIIGFIFLL